MKRLFLSALFGAALVPASASAAAATEFYINNGTVNSFPYPRIDATTFINRGQFMVFGSTEYTLFQSANTLNYTNTGNMLAFPGFRFDLTETGQEGHFVPKRSANFVNGVNAQPGSALIQATDDLYVNATNVVNRGTLEVGSSGMMVISGENVDLARGRLVAGTGGVEDTYWGVANTNRLDAEFDAAFVTTSSTRVAPFGEFYSFTVGSPEMKAFVTTAPGVNTDFAVDVLILDNLNTNVAAQVYFDTLDGFATKIVQWNAVVPNPVTGDNITNTIFLSDEFAPLNRLPQLNVTGNGGSRPENYTITSVLAVDPEWVPMVGDVLDPTIFDGEAESPIVTNAAYGMRLTAEANPVDPRIQGQTYTNVAGRIEIFADKVLDLTRTIVDGPSFLRVVSTNHFVGSSMARISTPFSSFNLATTNASMTISNLFTPEVAAIVGSIEVWSGRWTNSLPDVETEDGEEPGPSTVYNVTVVRSSLQPSVPARVFEFELRAPVVEISDKVDVMEYAKIDTERLTIATNSVGAPTLFGELLLNDSGLIWSAAFPRLRYLTNHGNIFTANSTFFGVAKTPPWFTGYYEEPYQAFVNHGSISTQGNDTWALYYESSGGMINSGVGPLSIRASDATIKDGFFLSGEEISVTANRITLMNQMLIATRSIVLNPAGYLSDGSLESGTEGLTPTSLWSAGDGIHLLNLPGEASLLGTEVQLTGYPNAEVFNRWAAADRGCSANGFVNNAALASLALSGAHNSMFTFMGVTDNNALYVQTLVLSGYPAVFTADATRLAGVEIRPGMKIYYAQAIADGVDISEQLNGLNDGRFCWVSDFAGVPAWTGGNSTGGDNTGGNTDPNGSDDGLPKISYPSISNPSVGPATTIGTYQGLFYADSGVVADQSGFIKLSVNNRGAYSGQLKIAGKTYGFSGKLTDGHASYEIAAAGLTLDFEVDDSGEGKVEGTVASATWISKLYADRVTNGAKVKSSYAGTYTVALPAVEGYGYGYGSIIVTPSGVLVFKGTLGDGTKVNQTAKVDADGVWPLYGSLPEQGVVLGWIKFQPAPAGQVLWMKNGSFADLTIQSSAYSRRKSKPVLPLFPTASGSRGHLIFQQGGVTLAEVTVNLAANGKITFPNKDKASLQIAPGTGLFNGSFKHPVSGQPVKFGGAILQADNEGFGTFITADGPGTVYLGDPASTN